MKKLLLSFGALASMAGSAISADLPSRKEPITAPQPAPIWTGFYAGLNAGGTWATNNNVHVVETPNWFNPNLNPTDPPRTIAAATSAGSSIAIPLQTKANFIGGLQAGYNERVFDKTVFGVETDFQGLINTGGNASTVAQAFGFYYTSAVFGRTNFQTTYNIFSASKNLSYLGTVRGRAGYLVMPSLLVYLTGGLAYGGVNFSTYSQQQGSSGVSTGLYIGPSQYSGARLGWTAGGGVEWFFMSNWSVKAEYIYYSLGNVGLNMGQSVVTRISAGGGLSIGDVDRIQKLNAYTAFNGNIIRAGVNYHFNFASAPLVAKF